MKKSLFIIVLFFGFNCKSQRVAIAFDKTSILYKGVDNPITVVVEDLKPKQFKLFVNNGSVKKINNKLNNQFVINPFNTGILTIYILSNQNDTIYKNIYRVKSIPLPYALVANKTFGKIGKNELLAQEFITTKLAGFDFDFKMPIVSYSIDFFKMEKCLNIYK